MFDLFRRKDWKPETLSRLTGEFEGVRIVMSNFPCRVDAVSGKRAYAYSNFGSDFLIELNKKLGDLEQLRKVLAADGSKKVLVKLQNLPGFEVEVAGRFPDEKGRFYSNIADALIEAFQAQGIKP